MKLNLVLKKGRNPIIFTSPVKLNNLSKLKINKVKVLWTIYNVGQNESIDIDSTSEPIDYGYYSFHDLSSTLDVLGVTVTLDKAGHSNVTPPSGKSVNLKNIGILLGFPKDETLSKKTKSPYIVSIHGGLTSIAIFCDRINTLRNYSMGERSEKVCEILVPPNYLYGYTSEHNIETASPLENGSVSSFNFTVRDDSSITDKDSYTLFVDCEIL